MRMARSLLAAALLLLAVAASSADAQRYCGTTPHATVMPGGWYPVLEFDWSNGNTFGLWCWEMSVSLAVAGTGAPDNNMPAAALTCTTGSFSGSLTVLSWLGMSNTFPNVTVACPYAGRFSGFAYTSQGVTSYTSGQGSMGGADVIAATVPPNAGRRLAMVPTPAVDDAGYCGDASPTSVTINSSYAMTMVSSWSNIHVSLDFSVSCLRATANNLSPVEVWIGCATDGNGLGNATIISRFDGNYLPSGSSTVYTCPFAGYFGLFVRALPSTSTTVLIAGSGGVPNDFHLHEAARPVKRG